MIFHGGIWRKGRKVSWPAHLCFICHSGGVFPAIILHRFPHCNFMVRDWTLASRIVALVVHGEYSSDIFVIHRSQAYLIRDSLPPYGDSLQWHFCKIVKCWSEKTQPSIRSVIYDRGVNLKLWTFWYTVLCKSRGSVYHPPCPIQTDHSGPSTGPRGPILCRVAQVIQVIELTLDAIGIVEIS